jgi:hypothetical protein
LSRNEKLNKICLESATKSMVAKHYCEGYRYGGKILWTRGKKEEAVKLLEEGKINCKKPYPLMQIRKELLMYKYLTKKDRK